MQSSLGTSPPVGVCGAWAQVVLEILMMHALENLQVAAALVEMLTRKAGALCMHAERAGRGVVPPSATLPLLKCQAEQGPPTRRRRWTQAD